MIATLPLYTQQALIQVKKIQSEYMNLSLNLLLYAQRQKQTQPGNQEQPKPPLNSAVTKGISGCFPSPFPLSFLSFSPSLTDGEEESLVMQGLMSESFHLATARQKLMSLHVVTKVLLSLRCMKSPRTPANCGI